MAGRLLTFRITRDEFLQFNSRHLALGVTCTWLVGIGRWWDDPGANLLQHLGIGSVIYIFLLSLLLYAVVWPLKPENWSYRHVLTFVSLTSPPAILYAIPVERFTTFETARTLNVWFLCVVAAWRVALLFFYMRRQARLRIFSIVVTALLPIILIIVALTALNLERAVFDVMGGLRNGGTANDDAYGILLGLTFLSMLLIIPLAISYVVLIALSFQRKAPSQTHQP
ncbi:MAG: hypothetical protein ABR501_05385 [Pyrinomonadaceae bacterium]